jgi:hypothetical protein
MFEVIASFGTRGDFLYAHSIKRMNDAQRMRSTARYYGYTDARVVNAGVFQKTQDSLRGGSTSSPRMDRAG